MLHGMQVEHKTGEHASLEAFRPGASKEAIYAAEPAEADDSAIWHADEAALQQALDSLIA